MSNQLLEVLRVAHNPCQHFTGSCASMRWAPEEGYVPRGVCGALGKLSEVQLVLVTSEPGDPLRGEQHSGGNLEAMTTFSIECLRSPATPFHKNIRLILNLCFPGVGLSKQLCHIWRTNSVLCSAVVESGYVPNAIVRTCINSYLKPQLALVPNAMVAALGRKAQNRLARNGIAAYPALHPSSRVSNGDKFENWKGLAKALKDHGKVISNARGYVPTG